MKADRGYSHPVEHPPLTDGSVAFGTILGILLYRSCRLSPPIVLSFDLRLPSPRVAGFPIFEDERDTTEPASDLRSDRWIRRGSRTSGILDGVYGPLVEFRPCTGMIADLREEIPVAGIAHKIGKLARIKSGIDAAHDSFFLPQD
ncbi:hypothetical protein BW13_11490 [Bifidobacterium sp. UTCIF-37]|nr:hypothetical protein BW13_11490 [Bifidobacterium sp. UTCIF-37]TPF87125.1 hypothetical protein BW11_11455 [Bifidobacterium sp. UTCIF-38]